MIVLLALLALATPAFDEDDELGEVNVGGRLFLDTRFSQYFFAHAKGDVNKPLEAGDPVMDRSVGATEDLPGPFAGRSMNCRACHLVNEHVGVPGGSIRTYTDYARRSPIPIRADGATVTPRRSPVLVNSTLPRSGPLLLHYDGEFASIEGLVRGTLTGRNFGWLPGETADAVKHIANVIRRDDGTDLFAKKTARLPYKVVLKATDPRVAPFILIPDAYRIDVEKATDEQVVDAVAKLIGAYVDSLQFGIFKPELGALYAGSPYDSFLVKNSLPLRPATGETPVAYTVRLRQQLAALAAPAWIGPEDWGFKLHNQSYQFGPKQLDGLKVFLGTGNCASCHTPPAFTDFGFHNTGVAQEEYDDLHGEGAFAALKIPSRAERTPGHLAQFRGVPSAASPGVTDLGVWNIYGNDAFPAPQPALKALLGDVDLADTIARFKTATVRDLSQTGPYFHTGRKDGLDAVLGHYVRFSALAREGKVRNADPRLKEVTLRSADIVALKSFLRSLNEDYND